MKKLFGFTLAEVLITLGIMGVIAALTLPALMTNLEQNQWMTGLKTNKSTLERAFEQMLANNSVDTLADTHLWYNLDDCDNIMKDVFKIDKVGTGKLSDKITKMDNTNYTGIDSFKSYALPNEAFLYIDFHDAQPGQVLADIYVDVNGKKLPNTVGKDIYAFGLLENARLVPYGSDELYNINNTKYKKWNTDDGCKGNIKEIKNGEYCTARVIENGFKIDYK